MTETYQEDAPIEVKKQEELRCIRLTLTRLLAEKGMMAETYPEDASTEAKKLEELRLIRCALERLLRVFDEGKFVDYQLEKFGRAPKFLEKKDVD